jgi:thymidylate synthase (FAD)
MTEVLFTEIEKANYEAIKARTNESANKLLGLYFPVLDHGFVSLIDYCGSDAAIARAARCSYGAGTRAISDDSALIRYLVRHQHTSPLEQAELTFHLKMPIVSARQLVRHRTCSMNEISGRYSIMPLQFYSPKFEDFKLQSKDNKQGRDREIERSVYIENRIRSDTARALVKENYEIDLGNDVARELARIDLPLSTYTEMYWKMDLHNLFHFLGLRCDSHAQYEIRVFANIIAGIVKEVFPLAYNAWMDYKFTSQNFSYQEMKALIAMGNELGSSGSDEGGGFETCIPPEEQWAEWGKLFGLSKRETTEFFGKLILKNQPNYTLDLSTAKSPDHFRREAEKYVPKI